MKDKLTTEQWIALITQASPAKLIVINYELLMEVLTEAKEHISDEKEFTKHMERARGFLMHLVESLNTEIEIGARLFHAYMYINRLFIKTLRTRKMESLDEAMEHAGKLLAAFENVCRQAEKDDDEPVVQNAEQVYIGLTYGKENLVETVLPSDKKRGFKV